MSIREQIHKMEPCVLHLSCLETVTEEQLQMRLWEKVGLWVELENIAITADYARKNFTALIVLDRNNMADAVGRYLASVDEKIVVAPAKSNRERHQIKRSKVQARLTWTAVSSSFRTDAEQQSTAHTSEKA